MLATTLVLLAFTHFVGDFILQNDHIAKNKGRSMSVLALHVALYGFSLCMFVLTLYLLGYTLDPYSAILFLLVNVLAHGATDVITSGIAGKYKKEGNDNMFFNVIGFDQFIHISTLVLTASAFLTP